MIYLHYETLSFIDIQLTSLNQYVLACQVLSNTLHTCFAKFEFFQKLFIQKDTKQNMHSVAVSVHCKVIGIRNKPEIFAYGM